MSHKGGNQMKNNTVAKLIALLLIIGGIAGATFSVVTWLRTSTTALVTASIVLVFGCSAWAGFKLWTGTPSGYTWAKILLAMQIPSISIPGFVYQFYTAAVLSLSYSRHTDSRLGLNFELGSALAFQISPEIQDLVIGVNLIAIAALIYLIKASRDDRVHAEASSQQSTTMLG
jgi:hypothetical protein